jgi:hypothetical protein
MILQYFSSQTGTSVVLAARTHSSHELMLLVVKSSANWTGCWFGVKIITTLR